MMHSVAWMVKYVFAAVGIVFSVLGYAASIPNSVIAFAAFRRLGPDAQSCDDNPAIFLASVWRCPTSLFPVLPWAAGVALIAVYMSVIFRFVNLVCAGFREDTGGILASALRICAVYVSVSCFRWILYSPSQFMRSLLLCFLCSVALIWFDRQMMIRSSRRRVVWDMYGSKSFHV